MKGTVTAVISTTDVMIKVIRFGYDRQWKVYDYALSVSLWLKRISEERMKEVYWHHHRNCGGKWRR